MFADSVAGAYSADGVDAGVVGLDVVDDGPGVGCESSSADEGCCVCGGCEGDCCCGTDDAECFDHLGKLVSGWDYGLVSFWLLAGGCGVSVMTSRRDSCIEIMSLSRLISSVARARL